MKNPELFHKTVGILVKAYFDDTLTYCDCKKCAVGNLVFANFPKLYEDVFYEPAWMEPFSVGCCGREGIDLSKMTKRVKKEVKSTGYDILQLADIEKAFGEGCDDGVSGRMDDYYNGLMCVVDILMKIHKATPSEAQQAKELFTLTA